MPRPATTCSRQRGPHLLRDMHPARGGGEARLLGDRDEAPQMAQFDVH